MQETAVQFLGGEDPLEEGKATHSSIPAGEPHGQRCLVGYIVHGLPKSRIYWATKYSTQHNYLMQFTTEATGAWNILEGRILFYFILF